jgi:iron-siderophore transport system ATP-binding protein
MTDSPPTAGSAGATAGSAGEVRLRADRITAGYDSRKVLEDLSVVVPPDSFTVIIGPNACGKSTLLRTLARLLRPEVGTVVLDGHDIHTMKAKEVARRIGLLPQTSIAPDGITVVDLVARGRYPHQSMIKQWSDADEVAVQTAMARTGVTYLAARPVDQLSGGQRQRVWIAMVLAQDTPIVLLDEPTTYLDISHQLELLELCQELNREGRTLVAILHDLNQAARYSTHLIAMHRGEIVAEGHPTEVVTAELVEKVFGVRSHIVGDPETGSPMIVPLAEGALSTGPRATEPPTNWLLQG